MNVSFNIGPVDCIMYALSAAFDILLWCKTLYFMHVLQLAGQAQKLRLLKIIHSPIHYGHLSCPSLDYSSYILYRAPAQSTGKHLDHRTGLSIRARSFTCFRLTRTLKPNKTDTIIPFCSLLFKLASRLK